MKLTFTQDWAKGGYTIRAGQTIELPDHLATLAVADGAAQQATETATRKTRTKKAVKPDPPTNVVVQDGSFTAKPEA